MRTRKIPQVSAYLRRDQASDLERGTAPVVIPSPVDRMSTRPAAGTSARGSPRGEAPRAPKTRPQAPFPIADPQATQQWLDFYNKQGKVVTLDGMAPIADVTDAIAKVLGA